jgi:hypothetical protein
MQAGDTFIWSPDAGRQRHLWIVLSDPNDAGRFVAVNLTTSRHAPKALTLRPGQHPFIDRDSDVNFGDAEVLDLKRVEFELQYRRAIPQEPMESTLVRQIAIAAQIHPAVSGEIQKMLKAHWR